jgi:hypothetical protein
MLLGFNSRHPKQKKEVTKSIKKYTAPSIAHPILRLAPALLFSPPSMFHAIKGDNLADLRTIDAKSTNAKHLELSRGGGDIPKSMRLHSFFSNQVVTKGMTLVEKGHLVAVRNCH